jgi:hypothetical protein
MYLHRETGLVYLASPRTASQATADALQNQAGFVMEGDHHIGFRHAKYRGGPLEGVSVATTVRYHPDAMVSWWHFMKRPTPLGEAFLDVLWQMQYFPEASRWWAFHDDYCDRVLRYENLDEDLNRWLAEHGLDPVRVPRKNVTPHRQGMHWSRVFDRRSAGHLDKRFGDEIRRYGYPSVVDEWLEERKRWNE